MVFLSLCTLGFYDATASVAARDAGLKVLFGMVLRHIQILEKGRCGTTGTNTIHVLVPRYPIIAISRVGVIRAIHTTTSFIFEATNSESGQWHSDSARGPAVTGEVTGKRRGQVVFMVFSRCWWMVASGFAWNEGWPSTCHVTTS
eukprot:3372624-Rhodomonas_salina.2